MREYIMSPFYSIENDKLIYLKKIEICEVPKEENIRLKILIDEGALLYKQDTRNNEKNRTILVVEPHPDDFALSAVGYIDSKKSVIVMNVFSRMNVDSFMWSEIIKINEDEYETLRIKENEFAIEEILGQQYVSLKEKSTRITKKDIMEIKNNILQRLKEIIKTNPYIDTIMLPMGIGKHPDHIVIYDAIMNHIDKIDKKIILYPEYPYARCKKFYIERLNEIRKKYKMNEIIINVEEKLEDIINVASVYRSQNEDANRIQMGAIISEDTIAIANEFNKKCKSLVYYEVKR